MANTDDPIETFWESIRTSPRPPDPPEFKTHPGELVIGTHKRVLVRILPDGTLTYGPEYTPDEAAVTFWEAMARRRVEYEERLLLFAHMERLFLELGDALREEDAQPFDDGLTVSAESPRKLRALESVMTLARRMAEARAAGSTIPQQNEGQP